MPDSTSCRVLLPREIPGDVAAHGSRRPCVRVQSLSNPARVRGGRSIPRGGDGECGNVKWGGGQLTLIEDAILGGRALWVLIDDRRIEVEGEGRDGKDRSSTQDYPARRRVWPCAIPPACDPATLRRALADRRDHDRSDEGSGGGKIGIAFGQDVDRGKIVFAEQIGQPTETPA
jgi:hypothetical protein